jgi:hypothetical protein
VGVLGRVGQRFQISALRGAKVWARREPEPSKQGRTHEQHRHPRPEARSAVTRPAQRLHERKRTLQRKLRPHEQALRDTALQLALDQSRGFGFGQVEVRWLAVVQCRQALGDEDARIAYRQTAIDLASALIRLASELPAPTVEPRLDLSAKRDITALVAAANGNGTA